MESRPVADMMETLKGLYLIAMPLLVFSIGVTDWRRHRRGWAAFYFLLAVVGLALLVAQERGEVP